MQIEIFYRCIHIAAIGRISAVDPNIDKCFNEYFILCIAQKLNEFDIYPIQALLMHYKCNVILLTLPKVSFPNTLVE